MVGRVIASLMQLFVFYVLWAYADVTTNPFILRAFALIVMVFVIVAVVRLWTSHSK